MSAYLAQRRPLTVTAITVGIAVVVVAISHDLFTKFYNSGAGIGEYPLFELVLVAGTALNIGLAIVVIVGILVWYVLKKANQSKSEKA